ncbi:hypothetical protein GGS20DRAFT_68637 [Poronia punctata]|nr:hypothetical protein GGS20DRAFT_68637 [Poronia punctata]
MQNSPILFFSILILVQQSHTFPTTTTTEEESEPPTAEATTIPDSKGFSAEFTTAVGVTVATVIVVTTLVCTFAHCWRPIVENIRKSKRSSHRRHHDEEEAWFCGDRGGFGLPMPELEYRVCKRTPSPEAEMREVVEVQGQTETETQKEKKKKKRKSSSSTRMGSRIKKAPASTLPSWQDGDNVGRAVGEGVIIPLDQHLEPARGYISV